MAKKAKKKAKKKSAKKSSRKKAARRPGAKKTAKKQARKKGRRTVLRSGKGKKLYAVRDAGGQFKDIQSYSRAHASDLRQSSAQERAGA